PTFLVLTALADGPRHGYGVIQEVAALSDNRVRLRAGTLYGAFDRLEAQGFIEADREEIVDGRLARDHRVTRLGGPPPGGRGAQVAPKRGAGNPRAAAASGGDPGRAPASLTSVDALERRYRRLLLAYPAEYRRERGDEIVGILLDDAAPGRTWPDWSDAADL